MNHEPVAWMREDGTLKFKEGLYFEVGQAFYTHPVKEQLTDEPMRKYVEDFAMKCGWVKGDAEGAFSYIQRKSYAQGLEDGSAKEDEGKVCARCGAIAYDPVIPQTVKEQLTDEEWNKAFDFYCETDEGVLRFDYELREEWKREQLIRWKEALRKANKK